MESRGVLAHCACPMSLPGGTVIALAPEWEEGQGVLLACPRGRRTRLASAGALLTQEKAVAAVAPGLALLTSSNFMLNAQSDVSVV